MVSPDPKFELAWERRAEPPAELLALPPVPRTIDDAVTVLKQKLPAETRSKIADMMEDQLIDMHFGLGMWIRNVFGLWGGNFELLESCGSRDMAPDGASSVILTALWKSLRQDRPDYPQLHALETRLFSLRVTPFQVRHLTFPEIIRQLNEAVRPALRAAGQPENNLVFVLSDGDQKPADEVRNRRFSYHALLKPWGISRAEVAKPVPPLDLVDYRETHLRLPSTVQVVPRYGTDWFREDDRTIFEEVHWRGDSFDVATTPPSKPGTRPPGWAVADRVSFWTMKGRSHPMSVTDAVRIFQQRKEAKPDEKLASVSIESESPDGSTFNGGFRIPRASEAASPPMPRPDGTKIWEYKVTASARLDEASKLKDFERIGSLYLAGGEELRATLKAVAFNDECVWRRSDKSPRLSPEKAVRILKDYLRDHFHFSAQEGAESILLSRLESTDRWYYEVCLGFPEGAAITFVRGFVLLDGRVIPFQPKPPPVKP